jgi:hypothetical protein
MFQKNKVLIASELIVKCFLILLSTISYTSGGIEFKDVSSFNLFVNKIKENNIYFNGYKILENTIYLNGETSVPVERKRNIIIDALINSGFSNILISNRWNIISKIKSNSVVETNNVFYTDLIILKNDFRIFDIINHAKAKGVNVSIALPSNWILEEGRRPNIIKRFSDNTSYGNLMCLENSAFLSRKEAEELIDSDLSIKYESRVFLNGFVPKEKDLNVFEHSKTFISSYPTYRFTYSSTQESALGRIKMMTRTWVIFYEDRLLLFSIMTNDEFNFVGYLNLYDYIASKIVLPDQFK